MRLRWTVLWMVLLNLIACAPGGGGGGGGNPVTVVVSPRAVTLQAGQSQAFLAAVGGASNPAVTWSVVQAGGGTVTSLGLYTAPASPGLFHVRATSVADPSRWDHAEVTVVPPVQVAVTPPSAALLTGQSLAFTATVTGTANAAVTWSVVEAGGGTVNAAGLFTAPGVAGTFHVRATSVADPSKSAEAAVTVATAPAVVVVVSPATASIQVGQTQPFTATVTGTGNPSVTWSVVEAGGGSVNLSGLYTAPGAPGTYHVRATSVAEPSKSAQATVVVTSAPVVAVSVNPATAALQSGQSQAFSAVVTGTANTAVTWSVLEPGGGGVTGAGLYTAPGSAGTFHVRATSVADPSKSALATVTVTNPPEVTVLVSPATVSVQINQTQSFTATVTGSANTAVTWSVVEAAGGTISASGLYTAPGSAGTFHVKATSVADSGKSAQATVTVAAPPAPSGYLFLTAARLAQIRADATAGGAAWAALRTNVEAHLNSTDPYSTGAENMALAYLVSADPRYAARAHWWAQQLMAMNLSRDSYYDFGEIMQGVAMVLNYCAPALSPAQATVLADFLEAGTDELWFHPRGSGWGRDNPRNNYHHTFLLGTACAGHALQFRGDPRGDRWVAKVQDLLERPEGVLAYLTSGVPGGDWDEGMNYAQGSVMHLGRALAILAAAGGRNYFTSAPFFQNHPRFTVYASQPGWNSLYPGGDLAWDSSMPVSPFRRAMLQPILAWLPDSPERQLGQWFLNHAIPSYLDGGRTFNWRTALFLDVLFAMPLAESDPAGQPLSFRTPITNWINFRSGWDAQATSLSISGSPRMLESHQHADTGSFTFWKQGWQAVDASTFSHSGLLAVPEAHNLLRVPNRYSGLYTDGALVPGVTRFADASTHGYVQVDATRLYRWVVSSSDVRDLLNEHTREFVYLRPNTLVLFDRVEARADAAGYAWCLHFPVAPSLGSGRYSAVYQGGGMSLVNLLGGTPSVVSDSDLEAGTTSVRVEEAATGLTSRFLNVLEVASGAAPATTAQLVSTPGAVQGARVGDTVVLFSDRPRGLAPVLPFSYTVAGTGSLTHLLYNLDVPVSVQLIASGGNTVVTVSTGSTLAPDAQGHVRFVAAPAAAISVAVSPATASVQINQTQAFSATVTGSANPAVTWSVVEAGGGSVSSAGLYTAPGTAGTYHVRATSVADPGKSAQATVTVSNPPAVTVAVSPATASVQINQTQAFSATVTGSANPAVTWSVVEAGGGSVSSAGLYTAPGTAGTYQVRATSVADPGKSAQATVTVSNPPPAGACNSASLGAGASLNGYRPFPADNAWNQDVSAAPVDPNSAAIINFIGASSGLKADFGSGLWAGGPIGIPYLVVGGSQAKVRIHFTAYGDESDPGPMPIPSGAPIEGGSASSGDRHVLVLDRDACVLYELYRAFPQGDGSWNADSAAIWDLKSNALRPYGWTSADAAGLPIFPGLVRYDEVAAGEITHALRFTVPTTRRAYVLPATHWASSTTNVNAPPMGMRVRLKAAVDISGYPAQAQVVLRALKRFGMILADNGSAWYISGAPDERWINSQLATLTSIKGSDLEVVQMGTIHTSDPTGAAPSISAFTASPATITAGGSSTLAWTASNATRFFVTPELGWVTGASAVVRPATTTTYTLTVEGPYGSASRTVTVTVGPAGGVITPEDPGAADVRVAVYTQQERKPISPWIYGTNFYASATGAPTNLTLNRMGGNRWTAYNWENNASNSGTDWGPYSNDGYLGGGSVPAEAVRSVIAADQARGMASLMTIQLQGYASADKNGLVDPNSPGYLSSRFRQVVFKKPSSFLGTPDTSDGSVYMDEFLAALRGKFASDIFAADAALPTFVSLDNEPELWDSTHHILQATRPTPDAYIQRTVQLAKALKDVAPAAKLFGPVHYGFNGMYNWQGASGFSDAFWFTDKYLQDLKAASDADGRRLLDGYDLHWYSEATGDGARIVNLQGTSLTASQVQAIVQAPRSLWDPAYTETSWIAQWVTSGPIRLLPRLQAKIDARWPGTKLAITEYGHGGDRHIAGAIAQADTLGIFGQQGVFAATLWPLSSNLPFIWAGFKLYRDYDGARGSFGNTSVRATVSDWSKGSAWASVDEGRDDRLVLVLLNKSAQSQTVALQLHHTRRLMVAEVYELSGTLTTPVRRPDVVVNLLNAVKVTLPALSASTYVLKP